MPNHIETSKLICCVILTFNELIKSKLYIWHYPTVIYMFKVNNKNTGTRYEVCSRLTIKTPEQRPWRRSSVLIVNFEHISHLVLVFLLLTLSR